MARKASFYGASSLFQGSWGSRGREGADAAASVSALPFSASLSKYFISFSSRKQGSEDNLKCNDLPNVGEEELLS